jgi:hypothetical protein
MTWNDDFQQLQVSLTCDSLSTISSNLDCVALFDVVVCEVLWQKLGIWNI